MATFTDNPSVRYCHCGNIKIMKASEGLSEFHLRYAFLAELLREEGVVVHCKCCNTDIARVQGVTCLADLDKPSAVTLIDAIDGRELQAQPTYSDVFQIVVPSTKDADTGLLANIPTELQLTLDSAIQQRWNTTQSLITEFTTQKRQEFKSWREQARRQASIVAQIAEGISGSSADTLPPSRAALTITTALSKTAEQNVELFQKSPVTQYSHPGASPLAAASLTRSQSEQPPSSPPLSKITPPPIPLSSSLKSPGSSNYSKPVKRVMFQDPPDDKVHLDVDEIQTDEINVSTPSSVEPTISIDDVLFDFDETIPDIPPESDATGVRSLSQSSPASEPSRSPSFVPPLSPFRRRSIEKYELPGGEEDPLDPSNVPSKLNGFQDEDDVGDNSSISPSTKPIAITPPPRSFLAKGLRIDEDEDEGGMKGHIERMSLKKTHSGPKSGFADQRMLWDIPGDYYRSVPS